MESADIKSKTLKLAKGGDDITYDKLIIATGSTVSFLILHCAMLGRRSDLCMLQYTNAQEKARKSRMYTSPHVLGFVKHVFHGLYGQTCKDCWRNDCPQALLLLSRVLDGTKPVMAQILI